MINPSPELQQVIDAIEVAKNHLNYAQGAKMIDAPVLDSSAYLQHGEQLKHVGRIARAAKKFQDEVREPMEALQRGGQIVQ